MDGLQICNILELEDCQCHFINYISLPCTLILSCNL
jgi:hypothetical protein